MSSTCPYCREVIAEADAHACPTCHTPHHLDCWAENGGCTVFGCASAPPDEPKISFPENSDPPQLQGISSRPASGFASEFLPDRLILLRNMLFVGLVAMPAGGLAGALLGFWLGFFSALFGAGIGCIFTFPMAGLCFGQIFGVGVGFLLVAILGDSFVAPYRRKALTFARVVFDQNAAPSAPGDSRASQ